MKYAPRCSFAYKAHEILGAMNMEIPIIRRVQFRDLPIWRDQFDCVKKLEYDQSNLRAMLLDHVHEWHRNEMRVHTDGSKDARGVGCAAVATDRNLVRRLPKHASIFTAKLQAIADALVIVDESQHDNDAIFSDSRSAIQAVNMYNNNHPIVMEITRWLVRLFARQKKVTLCWVPAQVNVRGIEFADAKAREAANSNMIITKPQLRSLKVN